MYSSQSTSYFIVSGEVLDICMFPLLWFDVQVMYILETVQAL